IAAFSGTVVFVSHDRYFIDRLATRVIEVENGVITTYPGNYEDYLRKKEELAIRTAGAEVAVPNENRTHLARSRQAELPFSAREAGAHNRAISGNTIVIEGGDDGPDPVAANGRPKRLNPIKQKQMEERCAFL